MSDLERSTHLDIRDYLNRELGLRSSRTLAVVSGKGGSGKTMFIACLARVISERGGYVTLVDTDIGTGGLSYYLSVNYAGGISSGLSEMVLASQQSLANSNSNVASDDDSIFWKDKWFTNLEHMKNVRFVSVGDHRRLLRLRGEEAFSHNVKACIERIKKYSSGIVLLDCRGGVDEESIAVCRAADDIVVLAETDPASFQTTQYLVDVLSDRDISDHIRGFVVNRVFDDPSVIVRQGVHSFRTAFLGAIPFDLKALREFNIGEIPDSSSLFYRHAFGAIAKLYPWLFKDRPSVWSFGDFKYSNLDDRASAVGGGLVAVIGMMFMVGLALAWITSPKQFALSFGNGNSLELIVPLTVMSFLGVVAGSAMLRRGLGNIVLGFQKGFRESGDVVRDVYRVMERFLLR